MNKYLLVIFAFAASTFCKGQSITDKHLVTEKNYKKYSKFNQSIDPLKPDYATLNACMLFAINEQRVKHYLTVLPWHISLETAAYFHSKAMADYNFFSHYNMLDSNRMNAESRGALAGIRNSLMGECIAESSLTKPTYLGMCEVFINLWMNSEPHRKIVLSENANAIGVGFYFNEKMDLYATLDVQCYKILIYDVQQAKDKLPFSSWFDASKL